MTQFSFSVTKQKGVILVMTLVMLVLLTLISVAGMRSTTLQEAMASNLREDTMSFQAAEAALRTGEEDVLARYRDNTLSDLVSGPISDTNSNFTEFAKPPSYELTLAADIKTSTEAGVPIGEEGMLVRIEGKGFGIATDSSQEPITTTELQSTFLVEK